MADEPGKLDISDEMIAERRGGSGKMPDDMPKWMAKSITSIDKFSKVIGNIVCWILMPLILAMTYEVIARKLFLAPTIWAYDISRFLYGALFMLGAGYALSKGVHIRADFLYRNFKVKNQGLIDFVLYILFYFPGLIVFLYMTTGFYRPHIRHPCCIHASFASLNRFSNITDSHIKKNYQTWKIKYQIEPKIY